MIVRFQLLSRMPYHIKFYFHGAKVNNRSLRATRAALWHLCVVVLLLLAAMPRVTVHNHAGLSSSAALSQHVRLFHADPSSQMPCHALHLHWLVGCAADCLPGSGAAASVDLGDGGSIDMTFDLPCIDNGEVVTGTALGQPVDHLLTFIASQSNRSLFCVWTC